MNSAGLEVRLIGADGRDVVVTDVPSSAVERDIAIGSNRAAWLEPAGDGIRLVVKQRGSAPSTIATYTLAQIRYTGEITWSHDGRRLAVSLNEGRELELFSIDESGRSSGPPRLIRLPVAYQYDMFWLPDDSGFTCIAQTSDQPLTHVALVRLADPGHPVLLTKGKDGSTWGHVLSPDGKSVAFQSDVARGGSAWVMDVAKALEAARRP